MSVIDPGTIDSGSNLNHILQDRADRRASARLGAENQSQQADDAGAALSEAARTLALARREKAMTGNNTVLPEGATDQPGGAPPESAETRADIHEILDGQEPDDEQAAEAEEQSEAVAEADETRTEDEPAEIELAPYQTANGEIYLSEDAKAYVSELERKAADQEASPVPPEMQQMLAQAQYTLQALGQAAQQAGQVARPDRAMLDANSDRFDPTTYQLQDAMYRDAMEQQQAAMQQQNVLMQQFRGQQEALLVSKWPEYAKPEVQASALEYAMANGYQRGEIPVDHRFGLIVKKAMAYDELQKGLPKVQAKLKGKPRKAVRPGPSHGPDIRHMEQEQELKNRAAQSGSPDDVYAMRRIRKDRIRANGGQHNL